MTGPVKPVAAMNSRKLALALLPVAGRHAGENRGVRFRDKAGASRGFDKGRDDRRVVAGAPVKERGYRDAGRFAAFPETESAAAVRGSAACAYGRVKQGRKKCHGARRRPSRAGSRRRRRPGPRQTGPARRSSRRRSRSCSRRWP